MLINHAVALKDVVWLNTNEQVNVIARYAPWDGFYMVGHLTSILTKITNNSQFHCHNLIHEDHEMMAAFNVTALTDLGYDEKTSFIDPMEPRYRNKFFSDSDLRSRSGDFSDSAIQAKVQFFNDLEAYRNKAGVESALEQYWSTKGSPTASVSATAKSKGSSATTLATVASSPAAVAGSSSSTPAAAAAAAASSSPAAVSPSADVSSSNAPVASSSSTAAASPSAV